MKIDNSTITVLKNFAKINQSILVNEGNVLRTISPTKTIMAKATVQTKFDTKFAIYNLDRFISTLSLFEDPELEFTDKFVTISSNKKSVNYVYCDENVIIKPPEKDISLPSVDVEFKLTNDDLKDCERALNVLGLPEIVVKGDGTSIYLGAQDTKNPTGDSHWIEIGSTDKNFLAVFKSDNIKIIPDTYQVSICSKGISHFRGSICDYFIAVEAGSSKF